MASEPVLVDLIADIVSSMRAKGDIEASSEIAGTYTLTSINELNINEVINIDGVDYVVDYVTDDSFTITAETGLDFTGKSWNALAPYYEHGHPMEINQTLNEKINDTYSFSKYPLIALLEDVPETHSSSNDALYAAANAVILIVNFTEETLKSEERYALNFKTILNPLYYSFKKAVYDSSYFDIKDMPNPFDHVRTNKPYYGTESTGGNIANIYDDPLDAILLTNADLRILNGINEC